MAHRQTETSSVHASSYHNGWIRISSPESSWEIVAKEKDDVDDDDTIFPATYLDLSCQIHMPGQMKQHWQTNKGLRWNKDIHFHENLRLPPGNNTAEKGMLVLFEAMASEGVTVGLSPQPAFQKGETFEITFGAVGNTKTTIKKLGKSSPEVSFPCRVCHENTFSPFWVAVWKGKVYAGIGSQPGQKCIAFLQDDKDETTNGIEPNDAEDDADATANETKDEEESKAKDAANSALYVGIGNSAQQRRPMKIRHLHVTPVPSFVATLLENTNDSSSNMDVLMDNLEEMDDDALKEYQEQCRKAKARAEKFGIEYKEPDMASVVPWSQARKLRANPQKGFITGIDISNPEELAKQEARKARFGEVTKKRELEDDVEGDGEETPIAANPPIEGAINDESGDQSAGSLPPIQAWDNEELVRFQRTDPPPSLWAIPNEDDTEADEFAMETDKPVLTPEKIHLFSIDWAAFKQIRTEDIIAYFTIYGPSYVEWLGDLSCNVLFEDKFSALRAMQAMALDLPSPPPAKLHEDDDEYFPPDFGAMGWKLGRQLVRKVKNDRFGRRGTTARMLMRPATSLDILVERPSTWPKPPPGFSTKRILGPGSDYNMTAIDDDGNDDSGGRSRKRRKGNSDKDTSTTRGPNNNNGNRNNRKNKGNNNNRKQGRQKPENSAALSAADLLNQGLSSRR